MKRKATKFLLSLFPNFLDRLAFIHPLPHRFCHHLPEANPIHFQSAPTSCVASPTSILFLPGCQNQGWTTKSISRNALLFIAVRKKLVASAVDFWQPSCWWSSINQPSRYKKKSGITPELPIKSVQSDVRDFRQKDRKQITNSVNFYRIRLLATASIAGPIIFQSPNKMLAYPPLRQLSPTIRGELDNVFYFR